VSNPLQLPFNMGLCALVIIGMLLQESENAIEVSKVCKPRTHECY